MSRSIGFFVRLAGIRRRLGTGLQCTSLVLGIVFLGAGGMLWGENLWMAAKARLADVLIADAFAAHLADGRPHAPWAWADLFPVAELLCERLGVKRYVLTGGSGSSMAFGLGHHDGTAPPNGAGNCVLVGHRDGAFAFLQDVQLGDVITVRTHEGTGRFIVSQQCVVSEHDLRVLEFHKTPVLTLITCYPFGGLRSTPWRYVVVCVGKEGDRSLRTDPPAAMVVPPGGRHSLIHKGVRRVPSFTFAPEEPRPAIGFRFRVGL